MICGLIQVGLLPTGKKNIMKKKKVQKHQRAFRMGGQDVTSRTYHLFGREAGLGMSIMELTKGGVVVILGPHQVPGKRPFCCLILRKKKADSGRLTLAGKT